MSYWGNQSDDQNQMDSILHLNKQKYKISESHFKFLTSDYLIAHFLNYRLWSIYFKVIPLQTIVHNIKNRIIKVKETNQLKVKETWNLIFIESDHIVQCQRMFFFLICKYFGLTKLFPFLSVLLSLICICNLLVCLLMPFDDYFIFL
jgi:hypothetical protein